MNPVVESLGRIANSVSSQSLEGRRILVTGATGFFGTWVLRALRHLDEVFELGLRVVATARTKPQDFVVEFELPTKGRFSFIASDVRKFAHSGGLDDVLHFATSTSSSLNSDDPREMTSVIVDGMRNVLEVARAAGARRFLFSSSGAIYGRQPPEVERLDEDFGGAPSPLGNGLAYHNGKRFAEHLAFLENAAFDVKIARCFAFSGPLLPLDRHFAFGNFVRDAARGGPVRVSGDGTAIRSYLDAEDLVVWLLTILEKGRNGRPYNVGSDAAISVRDLAALVATIAGTSLTVAKEPTGALAERYVPSTARARSELGLVATISLEHSIQRSLRSARVHA